MTLCLLDMTGKQCFELKQGKNIVGRDEECDVYIDHRLLSRRHAVIGVAKEQVAIRDLHSTNGTMVNFKAIHDAFPMHVGDAVTFGELTFRLAHKDVPLHVTMLGRYKTAEQSFSVSDPGGDQTALREVMSLPPGWGAGDGPVVASAEPEKQLLGWLESVLAGSQGALEGCAAALVDLQSSQVIRLIGDGPRWILGRSSESDLVLDHNTISQRHAVIHNDGGKWTLEDLGSKNGCKINDTRVKTGVIRHGSKLSFGELKLAFLDLACMTSSV